MTLTRSQRGVATRKPDMLGMVETPSPASRRTSQRAAAEVESSSPAKTKGRRKTKEPAPESDSEEDDEEAEGTIAVASAKSPTAAATPATKGSARGRKSNVGAKETNGSAKKPATSPPAKAAKSTPAKSTPAKSPTRIPAKRSKAASKDDHRIDPNPEYEFFGVPGVSLLIIGFPLIMYYMWIGATYYDGKLPIPAEGEHFVEFLGRLFGLAYEGAFPTLQAWAIYWTFCVFEAVCYVWLPGVTSYGQPLAHEGGRKLAYHCSGMYSFWTTVAVSGALHFSGIFDMATWIDEFGPIMSVAIISGISVSAIAYASALLRGKEHRLTGRPIYDFFMGAELNPRIGILDLKLFVEVRIPWYILFLISLSAVARQWEQYGYVSGEMVFVTMAHLLYANACSKGEHFITPTWDIATEKWGFMLIFWNLAGVPFSYCHSDIFLSNHDPASYRMNRGVLAALFVTYLFVYWVWDTTNSQKNYFRQSERGDASYRTAFPVLPWQTLDNPRVIRTSAGTNLLADGWYGYARKIHYTCDLFFALSWGVVCGFRSPFPWFYPVFFAVMIAHRARRDIRRCSRKYGAAWQQYKKEVPYLFIPGVI